jgi:nucleotide-binding universal stress UspA family protein
MPSLRKILVPMDGSPGALRALRHVARSRYRDGNLQVLVLNVQSGLPVSRHVSKKMIADYHAAHGEAALKAAREIIASQKLDGACYVRVGDLAATIVAFARETGCGEIVMGARGLGRLAGLLLGSVTTKVIHLSPVPVTIVK